MTRFVLKIISLCLLFPVSAFPQTNIEWSKKMTSTAMDIWKDPQATGVSAFQKWSYDQGVLLKGIAGLWQLTGDDKYLRYIQHSMDAFVRDSGNISGYHLQNYKLDDINNGKILLFLYQVTQQKKYGTAATVLRGQLDTQPRTSDGGFWHKKVYPSQMWLDGLYMAAPFYAEYTSFHQAADKDADYADIAHQFILMEKHSRDPKTGLLHHGWDESRKQRWADPITGRSPNFWGRAMGWYAMALVDALDYFPQHNAYRDSLVNILRRLTAAVTRYQDASTGCWYQVMDKGGAPGNYLEASASCMFTYALAKGIRKGYLPPAYRAASEKAFKGIIKEFIIADQDGRISLSGTCRVAGLGGEPYRDGSYAYYIQEKPIVNDPKGVGAFILAANEMEKAKQYWDRRR